MLHMCVYMRACVCLNQDILFLEKKIVFYVFDSHELTPWAGS